MPKAYEEFLSSNGRRQILIVDDEAINREILGMILQTDYDVLFAQDGYEALDLIRQRGDTLSLVLLDLLMPGMHGLELLKILKADPLLNLIPVIVLTADQEAEVASLHEGAIDFISKPYPQREVILARVKRTIELSEDRDIIRFTERDSLTGLYNREYFYRYAQQFDQFHKQADMDAMVVDVYHFHMINERYGKAYGDEVLRRVGEKLRDMVKDSGGIVCRREGDTFLLYCPHREDYQAILENASIGLTGDGESENRVRLRMGVYAHVDKSMDIERRMDRAKTAADTVRNNFVNPVALYDNALHESEIYAEQLLEDFPRAIREKQFQVYYQPKFDVRPEIPVLASAEALVRWQHPKLGMISPGVFIPLFEENGLIQRLDRYVWEEASAQIRDWKERLGVSVPVSVNVSRVDMYDSNLIEVFSRLLNQYGLEPHELLLEITESAYTQDSAQIISTVNRLRSLGFRIEMDDFGTGYSSLNMISSLPIDALKLDMKFIRDAFRDGRDTRLIEVIIDIADYLGVPVIAEGVETQEQLNALKAMGCDLVQGYYFSKPVPALEYERFIEEKKERMRREATLPAPGEKDPRQGAAAQGNMEDPSNHLSYTYIAQALSQDYFTIYYVNTENDHFMQYSATGSQRQLRLERSGDDFFEDCKRTIPQRVYQEDQARALAAFEKESLLRELESGKSFTVSYRMAVEGEPKLTAVKVIRLPEAPQRIIIGLGNADDQMHREAEYEKTKREIVTFSSIAQALAADYFSIYYVDTETDRFVEYSAHDDYHELGIEQGGEDFFNLSRKNILRVVHPEDHEKILSAFTKEKLLRELDKTGTFTLDYRLMFGDTPTYVSMKATRMADRADQHIVIGVNNIDAQMERQREYDAAKSQSMTYARIAQALSQDYYSIYLVNVENDEFIEYSSSKDYQELQVEHNGVDFFEDCRRNVSRLVYQEDLEKALSVWDKQRLMQELEGGRTFSTTYRLMMDGAPVYVNCKVIQMRDEHGGQFIVIGVSNVDAQMRREKELSIAKEKANRDALTGVKSKHAYVETEERINGAISQGKEAFSVVVCDVNGLKKINDSQGHQAGDQLILGASRIICNIFKHSPVFRIGGDEFVVVMHGQDYEQRDELMAQLARQNDENMANGGVMIAGGMSTFLPGKDRTVADVFDRADAAMYENKTALKGHRA